MFRTGQTELIQLQQHSRELEIQCRQLEMKRDQLKSTIKAKAKLHDREVCFALASQIVDIEITIKQYVQTTTKIGRAINRIQRAKATQVQAKSTTLVTRALTRVAREMNPSRLEGQMEKAEEADDEMQDLLEQMDEVFGPGEEEQAKIEESLQVLSDIIGVEEAEQLRLAPTRNLGVTRMPEAPTRQLVLEETEGEDD